MLKVRDLRNSFTDFFREREHRIVPSSPLVPQGDPTLLFTTAGMVQFKPMFAGTVDLEYTRAATVQKCFRTSDLENVGKTKRHLTFFEMLGNFSFGDYFKKESIEFAWDYSTEVIGFPKEKIWISIYLDDDEALEIWHKHIGVPAERIVRLGKEDNFWGPAGDSGACGPCSELYLDRGESFGCGSPDCRPGCECERFLEYWNLVFNQFNQALDGTLSPLPRTGIDTGMGLERLATLIQDVDSVFETDELKTLTEYVCNSRNISYEGKNIIPVRVVVEHARALTFAMSDGIYPSNDGRGYVLRRILRRGLRFTRQLGIKDPFVYTLVDPIVDLMGEFYPEIIESAPNIRNVIEGEEKRFLETIENGMDRLEQTISSLKKGGGEKVSGRDAFVLYDTFGFPLEMTVEMAEEEGFAVDINGFENEMNLQRERGKQSWKGTDSGIEGLFGDAARNTGDTEFTGYEKDEDESQVIMMATEDGICDSIVKGERGFLILKKTPFYGESGGQAGDIGIITTESGVFRVEDTKKYNKTIMHIGEVEEGKIKKDEKADAGIDSVNRNLIRANHTVTHLLQAALRKVLGTHVKQAGSLVSSERMRFDFSHFSSMTDEEIAEVETIVNRKIWEAIPVNTEVMNIDDAVKKGAMAVFDEKYEDVVRVVSVDDYSMELCGGTHVSNTGQIGVFKILREGSPGAGMRRIEGVTLQGVLERFNAQDGILSDLTKKADVPEVGLIKKIEDLIARNRQLEKELEKLKKDTLSTGIDSIMAEAKQKGDFKIITKLFSDVEAGELRELSDSIREKEQNSIVLFGSDAGGKALLLFAATSNAVKAGVDCGAAIKEASRLAGGGGGGRKDMAQAGGKNPEGLEAALKKAEEIIESHLG